MLKMRDITAAATASSSYRSYRADSFNLVEPRPPSSWRPRHLQQDGKQGKALRATISPFFARHYRLLNRALTGWPPDGAVKNHNKTGAASVFPDHHSKCPVFRAGNTASRTLAPAFPTQKLQCISSPNAISYRTHMTTNVVQKAA